MHAYFVVVENMQIVLLLSYKSFMRRGEVQCVFFFIFLSNVLTTNSSIVAFLPQPFLL